MHYSIGDGAKSFSISFAASRYIKKASLGALSQTLHSLDKTIQTTSEVDLHALNHNLQQQVEHRYGFKWIHANVWVSHWAGDLLFLTPQGAARTVIWCILRGV